MGEMIACPWAYRCAILPLGCQRGATHIKEKVRGIPLSRDANNNKTKTATITIF